MRTRILSRHIAHKKLIYNQRLSLVLRYSLCAHVLNVLHVLPVLLVRNFGVCGIELKEA